MVIFLSYVENKSGWREEVKVAILRRDPDVGEEDFEEITWSG